MSRCLPLIPLTEGRVAGTQWSLLTAISPCSEKSFSDVENLIGVFGWPEYEFSAQVVEGQ